MTTVEFNSCGVAPGLDVFRVVPFPGEVYFGGIYPNFPIRTPDNQSKEKTITLYQTSQVKCIPSSLLGQISQKPLPLKVAQTHTVNRE